MAKTRAATQEHEEALGSKSRLRNRFIVMILEFLLLYPANSIIFQLWLSERIYPLPKPPSSPRDLGRLIAQESDRYLASLQYFFEKVEKETQEAATKELSRVEQARKRNREKIMLIQEQAMKNRHVHVQRLLQTYRLQVGSLPRVLHNQTSACTAQDEEEFMALLMENVQAISTVSDTFIESSKESAARLASYAKARSKYDYDYFLGTKINGTIALLQDYTLPRVNFNDNNVLADLRDGLKEILEALANAHAHIDLLEGYFVDLQVRIEEFYQRYIDLYNKLELARNFTIGLLPQHSSLPDFFNIELDGIGTIVPLIEVPDVLVLPDIDTLLLRYLEDATRLISQFLEDAAKHAADQFQTALSSLLENLQEALSLEDYNPPVYIGSDGVESVDEEIVLLNGLAEAFRRNVREGLLGVDEITFPDIPVPQVDSIDRPMLNQTSSSDFAYLTPRLANLTIPSWVLLILDILFNFVTEIGTQVLRFVVLFQRYRRSSEVKIRVGQDVKKDPRDSIIHKIYTTSPLWLKPLMFTGVLCLLFGILWFPRVNTSCHKDFLGGTSFAHRTWTPLVITAASNAGKSYHVKAELGCLHYQRRLCDTLYSETDVQYQPDKFAYRAMSLRLNRSRTILGTVERCIKVKDVDDIMVSSCCGLSGYGSSDCPVNQTKSYCPIDGEATPPTAFSPLGKHLQAAHQDSIIDELEDARFDCTVLSNKCNKASEITVDERLLSRLTSEVDCQVHTYACWIAFFAVFFVASSTLVYLESVLFVDGLKKLHWAKYFSEDSVEYISKDANKIFDKREERKAKKLYQVQGRRSLLICVAIVAFHAGFIFYVRFSLLKTLSGGLYPF